MKLTTSLIQISGSVPSKVEHRNCNDDVLGFAGELFLLCGGNKHVHDCCFIDATSFFNSMIDFCIAELS